MSVGFDKLGISETIKYQLSILKLVDGAIEGPVQYETVEKVIAQNVGNRTIECVPGSCAEFTILRFRIQEPGDYFIRIDWDFGSEPLPFQELEMSGITMDYSNAVATGLVKILLLIYTIIDFACFCCSLKRRKLLAAEKRVHFELNFEQRFLIALNIAMLLFFDPVGIAHSFTPTIFTLAVFTQVCLDISLECHFPEHAHLLLAGDVCPNRIRERTTSDQVQSPMDLDRRLRSVSSLGIFLAAVHYSTAAD